MSPAVIWTTTDLRAVEAIRVGHSEIVYAFVSLVGEPSAVDETLLDDDERRRSRSFVHPVDCSRFVLAHVALRLFLARCLGIEPATVAYERGVHGKPRVIPGLTPLEFSLSHSKGLGLLAVARDRAVGVDVEHVRDLPDALDIADSHFSVAERNELRSLPPAEQRVAFFHLWTRKEAVIKASGEGLGRDLDSFDVGLAAGSLSVLRRSDSQSVGELEMSLRELSSPPGYAAAGAYLSGPEDALMQWRELSIEV